MAKFKPGIPDAFTLDVQPVTDLGDYLDEPSPVPQRRAKPQAADVGPRGVGERNRTEGEASPKTIVQPTRPVAQEPKTESAPRPEAFRPAVEAEPPPIVLGERAAIPPASVAQIQPQSAVNEDRLPRPKAPRREMSMTPETLRMSDELLDVIRSGSGQRDTKANELFHALVLLVHEAVDELDVHAIPKRGRWGSPTARAYPVELKNAFLKALLRKYGADFGG